MARLLEGTGVNANNGIISGVLVTVGDLARVVGELWFYRLLAIRKQKVFFFKFLCGWVGFCVFGVCGFGGGGGMCCYELGFTSHLEIHYLGRI